MGVLAGGELIHSSGQLTVWEDQSGFGNDLVPTQGSTCDANYEPQFHTLNNQSVVAFTGSASEGLWKQSSSGSTGMSGVTLVCVFDPGDGSYNFALGLFLYRNSLGGFPGERVGFTFGDDSSKPTLSILSDSEQIFVKSYDVVTGSVWCSSRWDNSGSLGANFAVNSLLVTSSFSPELTGSSIHDNLDILLNIRNNSVDTTAAGRIAEAAIYSRYLPEEDMIKIADYFEDRYKIVSGSSPS